MIIEMGAKIRARDSHFSKHEKGYETKKMHKMHFYIKNKTLQILLRSKFAVQRKDFLFLAQSVTKFPVRYTNDGLKKK